MHFEYTVRMFLGDKAFHIADYVHEDVEFRSWLRKCISILQKTVIELDTTTRQKEMLLQELAELKNALKVKGAKNLKEIILDLFQFSGRLLGFDGISGTRLNIPMYYQTPEQNLYEKISHGKTQEEKMQIEVLEKENTITCQKKVYTYLKEYGLNDNQIARVMNTSEHSIKKLKNNL